MLNTCITVSQSCMEYVCILSSRMKVAQHTRRMSFQGAFTNVASIPVPSDGLSRVSCRNLINETVEEIGQLHVRFVSTSIDLSTGAETEMQYFGEDSSSSSVCKVNDV
ncbi:hypothetical protein FKM82_017788 [Ascaphus truei]